MSTSKTSSIDPSQKTTGDLKDKKVTGDRSFGHSTGNNQNAGRSGSKK